MRGCIEDRGIPTIVYRLFDGGDQLLYVGICFKLDTRMREHERKQPWWPAVARREVAWWPTRWTAELEEMRAIRDEMPIHNKRREWWMYERILASNPSLLGAPIEAPQEAPKAAPGAQVMTTPTDPADQLREAIEGYQATLSRALEERDETIRGITAAADLRPTDVIAITGYSRETVRRILNPEARDAVRQARRDRAAEAEVVT